MFKKKEDFSLAILFQLCLNLRYPKVFLEETIPVVTNPPTVMEE